jgi:dimethylamine monooxygenase subunit A
MTEILQTRLPYDPEAAHALPGIAPLGMADWLLADDAFAGQMEERARLLKERRAEVLAVTDGAAPATDELLRFVLEWLAEHGRGYNVSARDVRRPDGVTVPIDRSDPMGTLGHLVQEDLCIMERRGEEHVLTAAVLCFPASWHLADKIGHPLTTIHVPVKAYDDGLARRVQRLFDGVQPGRPLWRFNALRYADATLHQPRARVQPSAAADYPYLRSERQCVLRLPETRACVFSIHTYVVARVAASG